VSIDGGGSSTTPTPGAGCTALASYANLFVTLSGHTQADSDAKVAAAWTKLFTSSGSGSLYFNGPGSDESFVKDTYNNDVRTAREKNVGANAEGFCASLLGFGLPASSGKAFVDKLWSAAIPSSYWDGTLYMLALLHVSGTFHLWY